MRRNAVLPALLSGTMLLAACGDQPLESPIVARDSNARVSGVPADPRPSERAFRALAREVPAFAGFYLSESGELTIQLTDLGRSTAMRAAMVPFLQQLAADRGNPGARLPRMVFRKADYSFAQLSEWRDRIEGPVFSLEGVVLIDLDERSNRLVVGIRDESSHSAAQARVQETGVPMEAVRIAVYGEADLQVGKSSAAASISTSGCTNLRQYCRPLVGGYQLTFFQDGTQKTCTLGFPVLRNGAVGFVTNSHCSDDEWNLEYTTYYQPYSYHTIGSEAVDPRGWSCEITYKCRYSDAVIATSSVATDVGYVARTTGLGSLDTDPSQPRFTVSSASDVYGGERVYMMGRTSGWLTGTVTHTCVSFKKTWEGRWHKVVCTDVANYNSSGGDSGSPVFLWNGTSNLITLVGVHFARNGFEDHTFFSPISGIREDLGGFEARAPDYRTTGGGGSTGGGHCDSSPTDPTMVIETC